MYKNIFSRAGKRKISLGFLASDNSNLNEPVYTNSFLIGCSIALSFNLHHILRGDEGRYSTSYIRLTFNKRIFIVNLAFLIDKTGLKCH